MKVAKRCTVCGKFREYDDADRYCLLCGHEALTDACDCGRSFDYALRDPEAQHCPRCGRGWKGRDAGYE